jgi:calpain
MNTPSIKPFRNQNFAQLKAECIRQNKLFVDDEFPPNSSSLFRFTPPKSIQNIVWKRPREIISNPLFFENHADRNDFGQGEIGDCWFVAAAVAVASYPDYLANVIPSGQAFNSNYAGIFHFRFFHNGEWVDVVIDDLLPVDRTNNKLIYAKNKQEKNEFWCSLLEKAYAKLNTCYEFLSSGYIRYGLIDLTGGVDETIMLDSKFKADQTRVNNLWKISLQAYKMNSLIGSSIQTSSQEKREDMRSNGLVVGHAYTITKMLEFSQQSQYYSTVDYSHSGTKVRLVRLRNPWGNDVEWNGRFSDKSSEWNRISEQVKRQVGLVRDNDGEFWYEKR